MTPATDTQDDVAQRFAATADGLTIPSLLDRNARDFGDLPALSMPGGAGTLTWRQVRDRVAALTLGLHDAGLRPGDRTELINALRGIAEGHDDFRPAVGGDDRGPVWVFSGQDAQWSRMGAELLTAEPVFAATVARIEPLVAAESGFSVTAVITGRDGSAGYDRMQPAVFTIQVAVAALLTELGAVPGAVIGHSTGEIAAAVVAGALSLEDGVRVVCRSARMMATVAGSGAVAAVELPAKQVLSELTMRSAKDAAIAVVAAPQTTVIAGARTPEQLRANAAAGRWSLTEDDLAALAQARAPRPHVSTRS